MTCALYRHFNSEGALLYVGISVNAINRTRQHSKVSKWYGEISTITIQHYLNREEAIEAEGIAVKLEGPLYNIRLKPKPERHRKYRAFRATDIGVDDMRDEIDQVITLNPLYTLKEAADALGLSFGIIRREIDAGNLVEIKLPAPKCDRMDSYITGWQLLNWLEFKERDAMEKWE